MGERAVTAGTDVPDKTSQLACSGNEGAGQAVVMPDHNTHMNVSALKHTHTHGKNTH